MIQTINAISFIKQIDTDGHSPLLLECDDGYNYYCKYRNSLKLQEVQLLVYEMLATKLLNKVKITCPEQSLVQIPSVIISKEVKYARYYKNATAWGSKEILKTTLLSEFNIIADKYNFNKLSNAEDLIRIAIFDLWLQNADRHQDNYNILLHPVNQKVKLIPIDQGSIFGGINAMSSFNETIPFLGNKTLITSSFYKSVVKFILPSKQQKIAQSFVTSLSQIETGKVIDEVFNAIPKAWDVNPKLRDRITRFLGSEKRLQQLLDHVTILIPSKKATK